MPVFNTKEEAKKDLENHIDIRSDVFCPLINALCVNNCECYVEGYAFQNTYGKKPEDPWNSVWPYCGNPMLTGERWPQN